MLDALSSYSVENLYSVLGVDPTQTDNSNQTEATTTDNSADGDTADLSLMGQLLGAVSSMDEGSQADLNDFLGQMRESILSGDMEAEEIADQASEELTAIADSLGIDLEQLVTEEMEMMSGESFSDYPQINFQQVLSDAFAGLDSDSDGALSEEELDVSEESFDALDLNGDGQVTQDELLQALQGVSASDTSNSSGTEQSSDSDSSETSASQDGSGGGGSGGDEEEVVVSLDMDGDGQVDTEKTTTYNTQGQVESVSYEAV